MKKVIQSVERRKKTNNLSHRLKSITDPSQVSQLVSHVQQNPTTFANFSNQVIAST
jgi:hypothetical protein